MQFVCECLGHVPVFVLANWAPAGEEGYLFHKAIDTAFPWPAAFVPQFGGEPYPFLPFIVEVLLKNKKKWGAEVKEERVSLATRFSHQYSSEQDASVISLFLNFFLLSFAAVHIFPAWCSFQIAEDEGPPLNDVFGCPWEVSVAFWQIVLC